MFYASQIRETRGHRADVNNSGSPPGRAAAGPAPSAFFRAIANFLHGFWANPGVLPYPDRMRAPTFLFALALASPTLACDEPVCQVSPETLALARIITFDDLPTSLGIGRPLDGVLSREGARFGERFVGQTLTPEGDFDRVGGRATAPLELLPGAHYEGLGVLWIEGTSVLQGYGHRGFPKGEAVGEGAVSVLFDRDQWAVGLDIRGGEGGSATLRFINRNGQPIHAITIGDLGEASYGFVRKDREADIAGLIVTNDDLEGIALDNLRFDPPAVVGTLRR